ncbi:MAG: hypothetical protein R3B47_14960 [Bacteroidia bacterium]
MPTRFEAFLEEESYALLLDLCLDHLHGRAEIHRVENGLIILGLGDINEMQCALDNLVRQIHSLPEESWRERVINHFGQLWETLADHDENMKRLQDFSQVKSMLRLRVYPNSFGHEEVRNELVSRVDFEGTFTCLVLDYDNRFQLVTKDLTGFWNIPSEVLFTLAQTNVNREKFEVSSIGVADGPDVYAFFSGELAASFLLDFEENAHFAKGRFGSLVAIPSKNAAFCVPIDDKRYLAYMKLLAPLMLQFYEQGPGQINRHFYWYNDGRFERFEQEEAEDGQTDYIPPENLRKRMG